MCAVDGMVIQNIKNSTEWGRKKVLVPTTLDIRVWLCIARQTRTFATSYFLFETPIFHI
jgi:hypothetical protein